MSNEHMLMMMQAAPASQGSSTAGLLIGILPWIAIFGIFYVLMIRPQQRRVKEHQSSIAAVKKGDEVVTAGGHIGKVTKVGEHEVEVEFSAGHRHRVVKSMLTEIRPSGSPKSAND